MKILVTGGTGLLGTLLIETLLRKGHQVALLTRKSAAEIGSNPCQIITWPVLNEFEQEAIKSCEVVINLAGESLVGRWTEQKKANLRGSRIQFTTELVDILRGSTKLHTFLSSSAIGYYGHRKSEVLTEASPVGDGFLAELCQDWEKSALAFKREGLRTVLLRTGIVLTRVGGILKELEPLYKNHLGGKVGSGTQHMSWIHVHDWIRAVLICLENAAISGPVNLVAPEPVTNSSFSDIYSKMLRLPTQLPAPAFALKISLGEMSSLALDSQNVRPEILLKNGFKFLFPYLKEALLDLYEYESQGHQVYEYFTTSIWIPKPIEEVFQFFSEAQNLAKITPTEMGFEVLKMSTEKIMKGSLIDYSLKVRSFPIKWRTEILRWEPPNVFTDFQVTGPYARWHHTHTFESLAGGTLMKDRVHYKLPLETLGRLFGLPMVKKDVAKIFNYRKQYILNHFGSPNAHP